MTVRARPCRESGAQASGQASGAAEPHVRPRTYVTVTSSWYVVHAVAQFLALERLETGPFRYHALCMDHEARRVLDSLGKPEVCAVAVEDLEDEALRACKGSRSVAEYCWTVKSPFLLRVLSSLPPGSPAVYMDADLYPFADLDPYWAQLDHADIVLSPHRFTPKLQFLEAPAGRYNAGLVGARNTPSARQALAWWSERSLEWCYYRDEDGKLGDQKYLLEFPRRFQGVRECAQTGVNAAPWNIRHFSPALKDGQVWLDQGTPLRLYHFHQYSYAPDASFTATTDPVYDILPRDRELIYAPYTDALLEAEALLRGLLPDFTPPGRA